MDRDQVEELLRDEEWEIVHIIPSIDRTDEKEVFASLPSSWLTGPHIGS